MPELRRLEKLTLNLFREMRASWLLLADVLGPSCPQLSSLSLPISGKEWLETSKRPTEPSVVDVELHFFNSIFETCRKLKTLKINTRMSGSYVEELVWYKPKPILPQYPIIFPKSVGGLQELTSLDISFSYFTQLPTSLHTLRHLTSLDLRENYWLDDFQAAEAQYACFRESDSEKCQESPRAELFSANLPHLRKLSLNTWPELQDGLEGLKGLTALQILSTFCFGHLQSGWVRDLPTGFFSRLPGLTELHVNGHDNLPADIWSLSALTWLDLQDIPLNELPAGISHMSKLKKLSIKGCGSRCDYPEVASNIVRLTSLYNIALEWEEPLVAFYDFDQDELYPYLDDLEAWPDVVDNGGEVE